MKLTRSKHWDSKTKYNEIIALQIDTLNFNGAFHANDGVTVDTIGTKNINRKRILFVEKKNLNEIDFVFAFLTNTAVFAGNSIGETIVTIILFYFDGL